MIIFYYWFFYSQSLDEVDASAILQPVSAFKAFFYYFYIMFHFFIYLN